MSSLTSAGRQAGNLSTISADFSAERPKYRTPSFSRPNQEVGENTQREVPPRRAEIGTCTTCRGWGNLHPFEACERCHGLGANCVPNLKSSEGFVVVEKCKATGPGKEIEQLESMMSDLELEGWHFVSHEEAEDYELLKSRSI